MVVYAERTTVAPRRLHLAALALGESNASVVNSPGRPKGSVLIFRSRAVYNRQNWYGVFARTDANPLDGSNSPPTGSGRLLRPTNDASASIIRQPAMFMPLIPGSVSEVLCDQQFMLNTVLPSAAAVVPGPISLEALP